MAEKTFAEDFSDRRIFIVPASDQRHACALADDDVGFSQAANGPTFIAVGAHATDAQIERVALEWRSRFGVSAEALKAARI